MRIANANVFIDGKFVKGGIEFDERIIAVGENVDCSGFFDDADGMYLIPGLVDVHSHGGVGNDVSDGQDCYLDQLGTYYAEKGVTSWCPTTMTLSENNLIDAVRHIAGYSGNPNSAKIAGIHLEGPFLSAEKCGAQNQAFLKKPDFDLFKRLYSAAEGRISLISVSPELDGAIDFISKVSDYTNVSLAHTSADYETAMNAFEAGANHITHTFNAMSPLHHRLPGVIAAAADAGVYAELITDGFHIHPSVIRLCFKLFKEKLCLISDSVRCSGLKDGDYLLGGLDVRMEHGQVKLKGTDTLAGSSIHLMDGLKRCVSFGIPLEDAVLASTAIPAESIGKCDEIGSLKPGKYADLVLLDKFLNVKDVYVSGHKIERGLK